MARLHVGALQTGSTSAAAAPDAQLALITRDRPARQQRRTRPLRAPDRRAAAAAPAGLPQVASACACAECAVGGRGGALDTVTVRPAARRCSSVSTGAAGWRAEAAAPRRGRPLLPEVLAAPAPAPAAAQSRPQPAPQPFLSAFEFSRRVFMARRTVARRPPPARPPSPRFVRWPHQLARVGARAFFCRV